jgi:type I restriction enzyme S subunit
MTPEGWRRASLEETVAPWLSLCQPSADDCRRYVALEHLAQGEPRLLGWAKASEATSTKAEFGAGDVLYGKLRPNLRKAVLASFDGICSTDILVLRPKECLDARFLLNLVHHPSFQTHAVGTASGTKMPRTSWSLLAPFAFALPPLAEQRKIAAILSSVDDAIEASQTVIDQLHVVKKAMMAELLTKGLPGRHKKFKQTEIGQVPEEWEILPLEALAARICVGIVVKPASYYTEAGVPCLRSKNVKEDRLDMNDIVFISQESNVLLGKSMLRTGDVVTVRTGEPGTSCVVPAVLDGTNCIDLIITTPGPRVDGRFLSRFLNSAGGRSVVAIGKGGLAQQHFNVGAMKEMPVPVPRRSEQESIVEPLSSIDGRLADEDSTLDRLRGLKSALMSVLLTGEVRVRVDEEAAA